MFIKKIIAGLQQRFNKQQSESTAPTMAQLLNEVNNVAAIIEFSDDAIICKTLDGIIASWNEGARYVFGYSAEEAIGKPITMLFPKERMQEEAIFIAKIKNNIRVSHFETERINKKGELISVSVSLSPIKNAAGEIIGVSKIARNITPSKRLQSILAEQQVKESRLAAIVDSSNDAIISNTFDGIVTTWNKSAEKLFGYNSEEMIGHSITKLFPANNLQEEAHFIKKIKANETIHHYATQRLHKAGYLLDVSISLSPIKNADGQIVGVSKIAIDLTELHKTQEQLVENHERLMVTLGLTRDAVILTNHNCLVDYLNPVAEKLSGYTQAEAYGLPVHIVLKLAHENTVLSIPNPAEICVLEHKIISFENQTLLIAKDGAHVAIKGHAAPTFSKNNVVIGTAVVFQEVNS